MNKLLSSVAPITLAVTMSLPAAAQDQAPALMHPPNVLHIFREDVKQGRTSAHEKTEAAFTQKMMKVKFPAQMLAAETFSGPQQFWVFEPHESFAEVDKAVKFIDKTPGLQSDLSMLAAQDGELLSDSRELYAVLRPDLSYKLEEANTLPKMRYFDLTIIRVRPGHGAEFREAAKIAIAAEGKANGERPVVTYQVVTGDRVGTYLLFRALESVSALDADMAGQRARQEAMGDDAEKFARLVGDSFAGEENILLRFNPRLSYMSKEFVAVDPDFWATKPMRTATPKPAASKDLNKAASGR